MTGRKESDAQRRRARVAASRVRVKCANPLTPLILVAFFVERREIDIGLAEKTELA